MTTISGRRPAGPGERPSPRRTGGLAGLLDLAAASHARAAALLALVAFLALAPGFFQIPPIDRDEPRLAQASRQMLESGDFVDIRFQGEPRYGVPAGIHWLQAGTVGVAELLGVDDARARIAAYRVPSLLGAIGAVLLTYWAALAFVSRRAAMLAAIMLATSILLGIEARLAKTDAVLLAAAVAAMGAMARAYLAGRGPGAEPARPGWLVPSVFWTAIGAGILIKGPVIVAVAGLAVAALAVADRSARWLMLLRPLPGVAWAALIAAPWLLAVGGRSGGGLLSAALGEEFVARIFSVQDMVFTPPGFHFLMFWVLFWPGAALAAVAAPAIWAARRERGARFLLAWVVPSWIALELALTKLPHYALPLYPAIAILIAGIVDRRMLSRELWLRLATNSWFILPAVLGLAAIAALMIYGGRGGFLAWPLVAGAVIMGVFAWRLLNADGAELSMLRAACASILLAIAFYAVILPAFRTLFPGAQIARNLRDAGCPDPAFAAAGYHEPSIVFLLGTDTHLTDGTGAADFLRPGGCRFALVEARQERAFIRRAEATGLRYALQLRLDGINLARGRRVSLAVYRSGL